MRKKIIFLLIFLNASTSLFSQTSKSTDATYLRREVGNYLQDQDWKVVPGRKPEVEILLLSVDSAGKIKEIHLFSDEQQRDFIFSALKNLTVTHLNKLTLKKWAGKLLVLPIITLSEDDVSAYSGSLVVESLKVLENDRTIFISPLYHQIPGYSDNHFVNELRGSIVDSLPAKSSTANRIIP